MLREERADDLLVGNLRPLHRQRRHVSQLPGAHVEDRQLREIPLAVEAEHVAIDVVDGHDALVLAHLLDRPELIAVHRGELEAHLARRLLHARVELARELVVPPVEELRDGVDLLIVPGLVHVVDARRRASLDLVLEARASSALHLQVAARAELEVLVHEVQRASRGRRRVVGAEVARAVRRRAPHDVELGPLVLRVEPDGEVVLVVAKLDVVAGPVGLDEVVLEDESFLLTARDDRLDVPQRLPEQRDEPARVAARVLEIAPHARPQALGFADVDDGPLLVLEEVHARQRGERVELGGDLFFDVIEVHDDFSEGLLALSRPAPAPSRAGDEMLGFAS